MDNTRTGILRLAACQALNFLYIGGTTLLTEAYRPAERAKVQGSNDFLVFATQAVTSLASGMVVTGPGWDTLNRIALPFLLLTALGVLWLWAAARARTQPAG